MKYSKGQKFSVILQLVDNDGSFESDATVTYSIYDDTWTEVISGGTVTYNSTLGAYIDVIEPSIDWPSQTEGMYFVYWNISNTTEDYPDNATEELYIESYDNKLDRLLGLSHENVHIDQPVYDKWDNLQSARLRIYSNSSSVGTDSNIIAEYTITADSFDEGKFSTWKQVKN